MKETLPTTLPLILEMEEPFQPTPKELDNYWANGWDRDAEFVFRQNITMLGGEVCSVVPLRVRIKDYKPTKSQRKILKKCADFQVEIKPFELDAAKEEMYAKHRTRFKEYVRTSLTEFFYRYSTQPYFPTWEVCIYDGGRLVAASFMDVGDHSVYSIYGMFDPEYDVFSLGKCTMLLELEFCTKTKKKFYYPGHCVDIPSFYDYKKTFKPMEFFDWRGRWKPLPLLPQEVTFHRLIRNKLQQVVVIAQQNGDLTFRLHTNKDFFGQAWESLKQEQPKIKSPLYLSHLHGHDNYIVEFRAETGVYHLFIWKGTRMLYSGNNPEKMLQVLLLEKERALILQQKLAAQTWEVERHLSAIKGMKERICPATSSDDPPQRLLLICQGDRFRYYIHRSITDSSILISKRMKSQRLKLVAQSGSLYEVALVLQVMIEKEQAVFRAIGQSLKNKGLHVQQTSLPGDFFSITQLQIKTLNGQEFCFKYSIPDHLYVLENNSSLQLFFFPQKPANILAEEVFAIIG